MANISKKQVKEQLTALGVEFETDDYAVLCGLLKEAKANQGDIIPNVIEPPEAPVEDVVKSCIGCDNEESCHPDGVNIDSRPMAATCDEWKESADEADVADEWEEEARAKESNIVHIENRIKKRNTFLADAVRNDSDTRFLNAEIGKRIYKGKIVSITTCKQCLVSDDGEWVTTFDIELKD